MFYRALVAILRWIYTARHGIRRIGETATELWRFYIHSTLTQQRNRYTVVQGVVIQDGQVLLVKRTTPRVWELPGGGIEEGETPAEAVVREIAEETGLQVRIERELGVYQRLGFRPHDAIIFRCVPTGGTLAHNEESVAVRFFPINRLPRGVLPWYREVIYEAAGPAMPPRVHRQWLGLGAILASLFIVLGERLHLLE
ncbi:MAG: NUDIX domain-containing protein [Anaerolineae bacterium]|nr:NUDIX domain-containing protein [Anaerolineae bacterium]